MYYNFHYIKTFGHAKCTPKCLTRKCSIISVLWAIFGHFKEGLNLNLLNETSLNMMSFWTDKF